MNKENSQAMLESLLNSAVHDGVFPGCCYSVITKNNIYKGSLGFKSLIPFKEENSIDTLYDLASLTKVVCTTTGILMLYEKHLIDLNDRVSSYILGFVHKDITIYHLLTHTSGLYEGVGNVCSFSNKSDLYKHILSMDKKCITGSSIIYSDINYILLGVIIEIVSKTKLDEFINENIFKPLHMYQSTYHPNPVNSAPTEVRTDGPFKGITKGIVHDETSRILGGVCGNAGAFSTITDLTHFVYMILNNGLYKGRRILKKESIDLLFTKQVEDTKTSRSIGWQTKFDGCSAGNKVSPNTICHTGYTGTSIFIDRDNEIGFVLLTNRVHPTRSNNLLLSLRPLLGDFIISNKDNF